MDKIITYSFCESFIKRLSGYINDQYISKNKDMSRLCIIFGGKRPPLFLKRELAKFAKTSFFPPHFLSVDQFIKYIIQKKEAYIVQGDLDNCFLIYSLVKQKTPHLLHGRNTFAEFLPWSRELINFIDQIDLENVSDKSLMNLEEIAKIGFAIPDEINRLLENIVQIRKVYHAHMAAHKLYSRGYQYLRASQIVDDLNFQEFDQILFCNFFYFNQSEKRIIESLYKKDKATFIFQGDQRRWPILKRLADQHGWNIREGEKVEDPAFNLNLYAGFDVHSQIGVVRKILSNIKEHENTVIVLPNPDQIVPLLSEISSQVKDFNISMGYPLKRSSLYTLFSLIFRAQLSRKNEQYYARDYLKVLLHPFSKNLRISADSNLTKNIIYQIEEILIGKEKSNLSGSLFFDLEEIESLEEVSDLVLQRDKENSSLKRDTIKKDLKYLHQLLFTNWENIRCFADFAQQLNYFLNELINNSFLENYPLNLNIAHQIFQIRDEIRNSSFSQEDFPKEEIFKVFDRKISSEIVAFIGSPLKGLQLLGLFETRSLNFDNVIVLDVNEGVLPRLDIQEPLIPRDVMISLGLNRVELDEEIQRYQFMRLISSAQEVHLIYQENKEKEKSRFVEELVWNQQKRDASLVGRVIHRPQFNAKSSVRQEEIAKTPHMLEVLKKHCFSASSLNLYLMNPIEFYYQYVLGLREQEDLLDEPEARQIGTFIHGFLEESFRPFLNKKPEIDNAFVKEFMRYFEERFNKTFGRSMKSDSFLLRSVIKERMRRFIQNECKDADRRVKEVLYLENRFENIIPLSCGDVRFSYIIDRVDLMEDGTVMIIDYKTGSYNPIPKNMDYISKMELSRDSILEHVKSFQIPLYFYFLEREFKNQPVNAALYNLRTLKLEKFISRKIPVSPADINRIFLRALDFIMSEILNPDIPFTDQGQLSYH